jgi:hypothetical protein
MKTITSYNTVEIAMRLATLSLKYRLWGEPPPPQSMALVDRAARARKTVHIYGRTLDGARVVWTHHRHVINCITVTDSDLVLWLLRSSQDEMIRGKLTLLASLMVRARLLIRYG